MKIGIMTWHRHQNFGSVLQAHALQCLCLEYSDSVKIIDYQRHEDVGCIGFYVRYLVGCLMKILPYNILPERKYAYLRFYADGFYLTRRVVKKELPKITGEFDVIVCGSDQIWAPNILDTSYMLDFFQNKRIKKVAYAASIGLPEIPENLLQTYQRLLSDFDEISVRETMGQKLLKDKLGLSSEVVLDPTLLFDRDYYTKLEAKLHKFPKKYIFCYFLNQNHKYKEKVLQYAKTHGDTVVGVSANPCDKDWMEVLREIGPREFLWTIHHAEAVFTDSYHGTIFSLLYQKEFFVFERFEKEDPINQNSRIYQLDNWFGIGDRYLCGDKKAEDCAEIDYCDVYEKLERARFISRQFIKGAIGQEC